MSSLKFACIGLDSLRFGLIVAIALALGGCTAVRAIVHNFADLDDYRIFENRTVARGVNVSALRPLPGVPRSIARMRVADEHDVVRELDRYLEDTRTAAFVVLHDDLIVYERYSRGFDEHSLLNSFSIAKAMMSALVGIAVSEGRIESLDAPVARYRPDLAGTPYGAVPLRRLLTMTSGMGDPPSILPGQAEIYYTDDLRGRVAQARPEERPLNGWRYSEADIQALGLVLEAAVGKPISAYLSEKLWKPLGMEADALWSMDRAGGMEKAFCCISARARDFARFGRLYLEGGRWNGEQLVPASWASNAALPGVRLSDGYTHRQLWWIPEGPQGDYYAYGHNGQYLYVNPKARVVIVKFSETTAQDPLPMFRAICAELQSPARIAGIAGP